MSTKVISIKDSPSGFKKVDGIQFDSYVYIGRPCYFGNPIHISGKYGDYRCPICKQHHYDAGSTLPCYEEWLIKEMTSSSEFKKNVLAIKGMNLVCFCKPSPCHGDIMAKVIDNYVEEEMALFKCKKCGNKFEEQTHLVTDDSCPKCGKAEVRVMKDWEIEGPYAVICNSGCNNGDRLYLTHDQYMDHISSSDAFWKCPICGGHAEWDNTVFNKSTRGFRVIIAGGRNFDNYNLLKEKCDAILTTKVPDITIVSGCASGADTLAIRYAEEKGYQLIKMPADWKQHGKRAGYLRNTEMAECSDGLIAFWDGESKGTGHMIDIAKKKGLIVRVVRYTAG